MGNAYYYFAATLPMLSLENKPPFSGDVFLEACRRFLSPRDLALMENLISGEETIIKTSNGVYNAWREFERSLLNELARCRAHRAHKDPFQYVRGERPGEHSIHEAVHEVSTICNEENLLDAEKHLDSIRWRFLDQLELGHYFDIEFLMIYSVKLKILGRHQEFASEKGNEVLEEYKKIGAQTDAFMHRQGNNENK